MIFKLIVGVVIIATIIYYLFCFLEIFGLVKFTEKNVTVKIPQMFIPFYYLLVSEKKIIQKIPESLSLLMVKKLLISVITLHRFLSIFQMKIIMDGVLISRIGYILKTISVKVPRIFLSRSRRIQGSLQDVVILSSPT